MLQDLCQLIDDCMDPDPARGGLPPRTASIESSRAPAAISASVRSRPLTAALSWSQGQRASVFSKLCASSARLLHCAQTMGNVHAGCASGCACWPVLDEVRAGLVQTWSQGRARDAPRNAVSGCPLAPRTRALHDRLHQRLSGQPGQLGVRASQLTRIATSRMRSRLRQGLQMAGSAAP